MLYSVKAWASHALSTRARSFSLGMDAATILGSCRAIVSMIEILVVNFERKLYHSTRISVNFASCINLLA